MRNMFCLLLIFLGVIICVPAKAQVIIPNDPLYSQQTALSAIGAPRLWTMSRTAAKPGLAAIRPVSNDVAVVVMDTGLDCYHIDLAQNVKVAFSRSFAERSPCVDEWSHGTPVAGIVGAVGNNGEGITGISWNTDIISFQVYRKDYLEGFGAYYYTRDEIVAQAFEEAGNLPYKLVIINASIAITWESPKMMTAIKKHENKVLVVAAAGNNLWDTEKVTYLPCTASDLPNVICVSAADPIGRISGYANYGKKVGLVAPGDLLLTTYPGNEYRKLSGTSFAAPMATGVAAAITQAALDFGTPIADLTPIRLKQAIIGGAVLAPFLVTDNPLDQIAEPRFLSAPGAWYALQRLLKGEPAEEQLPPLKVTAVTDAETGGQALRRNKWASIWGQDLVPTPCFSDGSTTQLCGLSVLLNGKPLPLNYVGPNQVNALLPELPSELWLVPKNQLLAVRIRADGEADVCTYAVALKNFAVGP